MKGFFLLFTGSLIFLSCSSFEEDREIKEGLRKYLSETLHDPESIEEINWTIRRDYNFMRKDSLDSKSPLVVDMASTFNKSDSAIVVYHVKLTYRAKNGFGAMRKSEVYATHIENSHLPFEDIAYSYESESFMSLKALTLMEPRRLFLRNEFLLTNEGDVTMEDFYREYPEFD